MTRTQVLSVHHLRRNARREERRIQAELDAGWSPVRHVLDDAGRAVPEWAHGVRVEKAGPLSWAVVATSHRGT